MELPPHAKQFFTVFHPYALNRMEQAAASRIRFVHYTSAAVARTILETSNLWMRQTSCMNDFSEVDHGIRCLVAAYNGEHGRRLKNALEAKYPGIVEEIAKDFDATIVKLRNDTFILSMSEHAGPGNEQEDSYGRLSMWRAYGQGTGVALVVRQEPFWSTINIGAFTSPVAYLDDREFAAEFGLVASNIEANGEYLDSIGREGTKLAVKTAFQIAAICTKHPGFAEEREWRVVASPVFPIPTKFPRSIETVRGVPQAILTVQLNVHPDLVTAGMTVPEFLDRVILGPTEFPRAMYDAFAHVMTMAKISDVASKLIVSNLPLRPASP